MPVIHHVIINTLFKKQYTFDAATAAVRSDFLAELLAGKTLPIPYEGQQHFFVNATVNSPHSLVLHIYGPAGPYEKGKPYVGNGVIIFSLMINREQGNLELWNGLCALEEQFDAPPPPTPFCARLVQGSLVSFPEYDGWLQLFEQEITAAWIFHQPKLKVVGSV